MSILSANLLDNYHLHEVNIAINVHVWIVIDSAVVATFISRTNHYFMRIKSQSGFLPIHLLLFLLHQPIIKLIFYSALFVLFHCIIIIKYACDTVQQAVLSPIILLNYKFFISHIALLVQNRQQFNNESKEREREKTQKEKIQTRTNW